MRILFWIFYVITILLLICSIVLIIMGNMACSGDGCMIKLLYIIGTPILVIFGIVFVLMTRIVVKQLNAKLK
jgi:hypothetical protein